MTDEAALLRAILDAPEDDTARLVYADCLDENPTPKRQARAEFIRVQCEAAKVEWTTDGTMLNGTDAECRRAHELHARETALLKKWAAGWLPKSLRPGYPGLGVSGNTVAVDPLGGYVRFERGFIAHAGRELPWRADESWAAAYRFGERTGRLFAANPLEGFTVSFEGASGEALSAEITRDGDKWQLMWDVNALALLPRDAIVQPQRAGSRGELGQWISHWRACAVREPAAHVAAVNHLDVVMNPPGGEWADPDQDLEEQQEYEPGYD